MADQIPQRRIERLPRLVVEKIAAGEMIERPASIVKELVENSLDAGAERIAVHIEEGGVARIEVEDDGAGIAAEDLPLAVASHATSKLASEEDLFSVATRGFRGEALASIGAVARLAILSRPARAQHAATITVEGGEPGEVRPAAGPQGTLVSVRDLFYNTPARRNFLGSSRAESGRVRSALVTQALGATGAAFTLWRDGEIALEIPASAGLRSRVEQLFGKGLARDLIEAEGGAGPYRIEVLAGTPDTQRGDSRAQHLFVNGRPISDRSLARAIAEGYRDYLPRGRYPAVFLRIEVDPSLVDVNVHPAKTEVRFQAASILHGGVVSLLRATLRAGSLTPVYRHPVAPARLEIRDREVTGGVIAQGKTGGSGQETADLRFAICDLPASAAGGAGPDTRRSQVAKRQAQAAFQVHDAYIVEEVPGGIRVVDQHALHERALYHQLRERLSAGSLPSQGLLVPLGFAPGPEDAARLLEAAPLLQRLGLRLEPDGEQGVRIVGAPVLLATGRILPFVADAAAALAEDGSLAGDPVRLLEPVIARLACRAAVKAGDRLSTAEIQSILALRDRIGQDQTCPHGRPTTIEIGLGDLERCFHRR